jgi:hypothetical protein
MPLDSGRFHKLYKEERTMGKGDHSQKNDKKNKKVKKETKKPGTKSQAPKR